MNFVANLLSTIKNGALNRSKYVIYKTTSAIFPEKLINILNILQKTGVIRGFSYKKVKKISKIQGSLIIYIKYDAFGASVIDTSFYISKPSRRIYISAAALWQSQATTGFLVLSTVYGILTDIEARRYNIGGEVIFGIN